MADRIVEVLADFGPGASPRHRSGTGCLVVGRTVLTAAHVVAGAENVSVRGPDKIKHPAELDPAFIGDPNGPGPGLAPDLALLTITTGQQHVPPLPLALLDRTGTAGELIERCHCVGYPRFAQRHSTPGSPKPLRDTVHAHGTIPVLDHLVTGLLTLQVSSSPRDLPAAEESLGNSPWSGMSGAPVLAHGHLVGVVIEHAPRSGPSAITAIPLSALVCDPSRPLWGPGVSNPAAWWARLGTAPPGHPALPRLPHRSTRRAAPYRSTIREVHSRGGTLVDRDAELAKIAAFALGPPGYWWLVGDAWAGKTSLLAEAVTAALPDTVDAVAYFLSQREADADASRFLAAVIPQLAELLDEDPPPAGLHEFRALWERATATTAARGRNLLLIVDGLDEDLRPPSTPSVASWLPAIVPGRAHVLVSSRPHPDLPLDVPSAHPLRAAEQHSLEPFAGSAELAALARQEIDQLKRRDPDDLALTVLGVLTAAAGPLTVDDLAVLIGDVGRGRVTT